MEILEDIAKVHDITPHMCKQYLKFMRKYKEFIIGKKV